jgi:hypothetical protein
VKLHPVVVAQPPRKFAHGDVEAALVQADEADDVAWWGVGVTTCPGKYRTIT